MKRYSFFIGALSAVATFVSLSAFTGRRPWTREDRWSHGWHRHHCDRDGRIDNDRDSIHQRSDRRQTVPIDSATRDFNRKPDSMTNQ